MSRKTTIPGAAAKIDECARFIQEKYQRDGYGTQRLLFEENGTQGMLVQIKNATTTGGSLLRTVTGLSSCATLKLSAAGDDLSIEVMAGKWLDKVGAAAVSMVILWPLLVTASIGAFRQKAFLDRVYNETLTWLATQRS